MTDPEHTTLILSPSSSPPRRLTQIYTTSTPRAVKHLRVLRRAPSAEAWIMVGPGPNGGTRGAVETGKRLKGLVLRRVRWCPRAPCLGSCHHGGVLPPMLGRLSRAPAISWLPLRFCLHPATVRAAGASPIAPPRPNSSRPSGANTRSAGKTNELAASPRPEPRAALGIYHGLLSGTRIEFRFPAP